MKSIKSIKYEFTTSLESVFSVHEINLIWNQWIVKEILNLSLINYFLHKDFNINQEKYNKIILLSSHLLNNKPIQYFFGYVYFKNIKIQVDSNVLIPRPETEELVDLVVSNLDNDKLYDIIDIGTGSGCIALALKKAVKSNILGIDVCNEALKKAKSNSVNNNLHIDFQLLDILNSESYKKLPKFDIIVSNPPYVLPSEVSETSNIHFEPRNAIFVPNKNPLLFYESISIFSKTKLKKNGKIFFEINPNLSSNLFSMLLQFGFKNIKICKDFYGKKRFIVVYF